MIFDSMNSINDEMLAKVSGVMVAIVTDNNDPESLGRIKVKLPIHDDHSSTDWVRLATLMSGKERGTLFIPEVGDEVLVAFHMGDISEPYVIGSLWNAQELPPSGKDEQNNVRKIKSRSGNEITFDDTSGREKIILKSHSGHQLELDDQNNLITLQDSSGRSKVSIKGGHVNEITIKSNSASIVINQYGDITIDSTTAVKIKGTQLNLEASAMMSLKAAAALDIKCDGIVNIKGAMVKIN